MAQALAFADYPEKERVRAKAIHGMCREVSVSETECDLGRLQAIELVARAHARDERWVADGRTVRVGLSAARLRMIYYRWLREPGPMACIRRYVTPPPKLVPPELIEELDRLATLSGSRNNRAAMAKIEADWRAGKPVAGLGTAREWWSANRPGEPWPDKWPKFPFSSTTLYKKLPSRRATLRILHRGRLLPTLTARQGLTECIDELRGQLEAVVPSSETLRILDALLCLLGTARSRIGSQLGLKGNVIGWAFESGKLKRAQEVRCDVLTAIDALIRNHRSRPGRT